MPVSCTNDLRKPLRPVQPESLTGRPLPHEAPGRGARPIMAILPSAKSTSRGQVPPHCNTANNVNMPRWLRAPTFYSLREPLPRQPLVDKVRGRGIVGIHHQHVGVALDADLRKVDHVDGAAGGADRLDV